jgi:putative thioredoxin
MSSPTAIDVTDETFQAEVIDRSAVTPVVVDLWAEWCGPCRQLGPILEEVVASTEGKVVLAKIDVDSNPRASQTFRVQSIPAVYAVKDRAVVDGFVGAMPEWQVRQFVEKLVPTAEETEVDRLLAAGDEASLRSALELEPADDRVVTALAALLADSDRGEEALALLAKIPETAETRRIAAVARAGGQPADDPEAVLEELLPKVKGDPDARQRFVDLLELLGPDDPRTAEYRKRLTTALY